MPWSSTSKPLGLSIAFAEDGEKARFFGTRRGVFGLAECGVRCYTLSRCRPDFVYTGRRPRSCLPSAWMNIDGLDAKTKPVRLRPPEALRSGRQDPDQAPEGLRAPRAQRYGESQALYPQGRRRPGRGQ